MIFVVEAIGRWRCGYLAHSTAPLVESTRIAERAVSLIPCTGNAPGRWSSGCPPAAGDASAAAIATIRGNRSRLTVGPRVAP